MLQGSSDAVRMQAWVLHALSDCPSSGMGGSMYHFSTLNADLCACGWPAILCLFGVLVDVDGRSVMVKMLLRHDNHESRMCTKDGMVELPIAGRPRCRAARHSRRNHAEK
jgi:hypothetical protein